MSLLENNKLSPTGNEPMASARRRPSPRTLARRVHLANVRTAARRRIVARRLAALEPIAAAQAAKYAPGNIINNNNNNNDSYYKTYDDIKDILPNEASGKKRKPTKKKRVLKKRKPTKKKRVLKKRKPTKKNVF